MNRQLAHSLILLWSSYDENHRGCREELDKCFVGWKTHAVCIKCRFAMVAAHSKYHKVLCNCILLASTVFYAVHMAVIRLMSHAFWW